MRVLGFGDNIVDRFLDRRIEYPGGNAVNVAVYARRLGAHAEYLGVFGDDELGAFLRASIEDAGAPTPRGGGRGGESGVSSLRVIEGDRVFLGWNGGGVTVEHPIDLADGRDAYAASFDVVHTSVYSRTEDELPRLRSLGVLVSFDASSEDEFRDGAYLDRVAPHADLVLFSCSGMADADAFALLDDAVARGAGLAVATRGTESALVTDGTLRCLAPAERVDDDALIDTMGCGDAFLAGFLVALHASGWRRDAPASEDALRSALHAGAVSAREQCFVEGAFGRGRPAGEVAPANMW